MLALGVTPCNRKHQSGEEEKTKNAKQVRKRDQKKNKYVLRCQGKWETEESEGWLTVTSAEVTEDED